MNHTPPLSSCCKAPVTIDPLACKKCGKPCTITHSVTAHDELRGKNILMCFQKDGHTSFFDYKDGKWQFWGDVPIDESAKMLFDKLGELVDGRLQVLLHSQNEEMSKKVEDIDVATWMRNYGIDDVSTFSAGGVEETLQDFLSATLAIIRSNQGK